MAVTSIADLVCKLKITEGNTLIGAGNTAATYEHMINLSTRYLSGITANKGDRVWSDRQSAAAGVNSIDLAGTLTSVLSGAVVTFVTVKGILIRNLSSTSTENLAIGGGANPLINWVADATDIVNLGPSGVFLLVSPIDGYDVTADTGDLLQIDPGADTISYDIIVWGTSA